MGTSTTSNLDTNFTTDQLQEINNAMDVIFGMFGGAEKFHSQTNITSMIFQYSTEPPTSGSLEVAWCLGNGIIKLTGAAFNPAPLVSGWFIAHEVGHTYDFSLAEDDPKRYRSQIFVDHFVKKCWWTRLWGLPSCKVAKFIGCGGKKWTTNVSNSGTTIRGQLNSAEDFADTFAVAYALTINHQSLPYRSFNSQWRLDVMTNLIKGLPIS